MNRTNETGGDGEPVNRTALIRIGGRSPAPVRNADVVYSGGCINMDIYGLFSLLGGVGLFLFGMSVMSSGLTNACGSNLQNILAKATGNTFKAVMVGLGMTLLIQSSSATDVMVIGFVNAKMMTLSQAVGVILGANIGTTITAQITAFDLGKYAPLILFIGAMMYLFVKKNLVKHIGEIIMGFGMLFVGIDILKQAILPLQESEEFISFMSSINNPVIAVLFGIAFTALLQSSSSSTVIFQTFAVQGLIPYSMAVYLVIGAAIGSVTPNILASLTTGRDGKRTAALNLIFNIYRAILLIILINIFPGILTAIQSLSPDSVARQIANTHTIFAIIAVATGVFLTRPMIWLAEKVIPVLPAEDEMKQERKLQYMSALSSVPVSMAVDQAHREVTRVGRIAAQNLRDSIDCFFDYTEEKAEAVRNREESVNILNNTIPDAMAKLRSYDLSREHLHKISVMTISLTDIERISDHAINIVEYAEDMRQKRASLSDDALNELSHMASDSLSAVDISLDIFETEDFSRLGEQESLEKHVDMQESELIAHHVDRLMQNICDPTGAVVFTDMVADLERCADHADNLAHALT